MATHFDKSRSILVEIDDAKTNNEEKEIMNQLADANAFPLYFIPPLHLQEQLVNSLVKVKKFFSQIEPTSSTTSSFDWGTLGDCEAEFDKQLEENKKGSASEFGLTTTGQAKESVPTATFERQSAAAATVYGGGGQWKEDTGINHGKNESTSTISVNDEDVSDWLTVAGLWLDFWCSEQLEGYVRVQEGEKRRLKQILDKMNSDLTLLLLNDNKRKREQESVASKFSGDGKGCTYDDDTNISYFLPPALILPPEVLHTLPPLVITTNPTASSQTSCAIVAVFTSFPQLVSFIFDTILRISCWSERGDVGTGVLDEKTNLSSSSFGKNEFLKMSPAALETQRRKLDALLSSTRYDRSKAHAYDTQNAWHPPSSLSSPPDISNLSPASNTQRTTEQTLMSKFKALTEIENPFIVVNRYSSAWTEIGAIIKDLEDSIHPNLTIHTLDSNVREILRLSDEIKIAEMKRRKGTMKPNCDAEALIDAALTAAVGSSSGRCLLLGSHPPPLMRFESTYSIPYLRDVSTSALFKSKYPTFTDATAPNLTSPYRGGGAEAADLLPPNLNINSSILGTGDDTRRISSFSSPTRKLNFETMSLPTKYSSILDIIFHSTSEEKGKAEEQGEGHRSAAILQANAPFVTSHQSTPENNSSFRRKRKGVPFVDGEILNDKQLPVAPSLVITEKQIPEYLRRALLSTAVANTRRNTATATAFLPLFSTRKPTDLEGDEKADTFLAPSTSVSIQCSCVNYEIATAFLKKLSCTEREPFASTIVNSGNNNVNNNNSTSISIRPSTTVEGPSSPQRYKRYNPLSNCILMDVVAPLLQLQRKRPRKEKSDQNNNTNTVPSNGSPSRDPSCGEEPIATDDHEQRENGVREQEAFAHENEAHYPSHERGGDNLFFPHSSRVPNEGPRALFPFGNGATDQNAINRMIRERYISLPSPIFCFNLALLAATDCGTEQTLGTDAGYVNRGAGDAWAGLADYLRVVERRIDTYIFDNLNSVKNSSSSSATNDISCGQNHVSTSQTVLSSGEIKDTTRNMTIEYGSENDTAAADGWCAKKSSFCSSVQKSPNTILLESIICDYNDIYFQYNGGTAATGADHQFNASGTREGTSPAHGAGTCSSSFGGGTTLVGTSTRRQYLLAMFPINSGVSFCTQPPAKDEVGTLVFGRFLTSQVNCRINSIRCDPADPRHWNSLGVELGNALAFSSIASVNEEANHKPTHYNQHTDASFPPPASLSPSPEALATTTQRRPPFIKVPIPPTHSCFAAYKKCNGLPKAIYPFYPASMGLDKILRVIADESASAKLFHSDSNHSPPSNTGMQMGVPHTNLFSLSTSSSSSNAICHQIPVSPYAVAQQMLASPTPLGRVNPSSPMGTVLSAAHPNAVLKALQLVAVEGLRSRFTHDHHDNPLHRQNAGLSGNGNNNNNACDNFSSPTSPCKSANSFFAFLGAPGLAHCKQWSSPIDFRDRNLRKQQKGTTKNNGNLSVPVLRTDNMKIIAPLAGVVDEAINESEGDEKAGEEEPFLVVGDSSHSTCGTFFHSSGGEREGVEVSSSSSSLVSKQLCFVRAILLDEGFAAPWINACDTIPTDEEAEILQCALQRQVANLKRKLKERGHSTSTRSEKKKKNKNSSNKDAGLTVESERESEMSGKRDIYQQVEAIHGTQSMLHQRRGGGHNSVERANSVCEQEHVVEGDEKGEERRSIKSSVTPVSESVPNADNRSEREGETSEESGFAETNEVATRHIVAPEMDLDGDSFCVRRNVSRRAAATECFSVGNSAQASNTSLFTENRSEGEEQEEEMESVYNLQRMHMAIDGASTLTSESQRRGVRIGSLVHTKKDCLVEAILRNPTNADVWNRLGYLLAEEEARVEAGIKIDIMREQELKREDRRIEKNEKLLEQRRRKATLATEASSSRPSSSSASAARSRTVSSSRNTTIGGVSDARMRDTAIIAIDASPSDDHLAVSTRSRHSNSRMEEGGTAIEEQLRNPKGSTNVGDEQGTSTIATTKNPAANLSELLDVTAVSAYKSISRVNTKSGGLCVTETLKRVDDPPLRRVSLLVSAAGKKSTDDNASSTSRACSLSEVAQEVASSPIFVIISTSTAPISGEFGFGRRLQHIFTKEQCFALAVEFDPSDGNSWNNLGVSLVEDDGGVGDDNNGQVAGVKIGTPRFIKDIRTKIDIAQKEIGLLSQRYLHCQSTLQNYTEKCLSINLPLFSTNFLSALENSYECSSIFRSYQALTTELKNMLAMCEWNRHSADSYLQVKKEREHTHARVRYSSLTLIVGDPLDRSKEKKNTIATTENSNGLRNSPTKSSSSSSSIALGNAQQPTGLIWLKAHTAPLNSFSRIQCFVRAAHLGSDAARETLDELCNADELRYQNASRARRREGEKVKQSSGTCAVM